mgnify:CR=1 FL=1
MVTRLIDKANAVSTLCVKLTSFVMVLPSVNVLRLYIESVYKLTGPTTIGIIENTNRMAMDILNIRLRFSLLRNLWRVDPKVSHIPMVNKPLIKYMIIIAVILPIMFDGIEKVAIAPIEITQAFGFTH